MQTSRRRLALAALASGALGPLASFAQQAQKVRRIGVLTTISPQGRFRTSFPAYLQRLGYEEGENLAIEWRFAEGKLERLPELAQELVALDPELIVTQYNESTEAIRQATQTIPIVLHGAWLPVENGYAASLGRPGGNITGTSWVGIEQNGKYLQVVREVVPKATHVANMFSPNPGWELGHAVTERVAKTLGIRLLNLILSKPEELRQALEQVASAKPDALLVWPSTVTSTLPSLKEIVNFAIKQKLVTIATLGAFADSGLMLAYGPDIVAIVGRTASYVDRILRGAKPAELPIELPAKFELVINTKTARAIGYTIPPALLARADRVIE